MAQLLNVGDQKRCAGGKDTELGQIKTDFEKWEFREACLENEAHSVQI